MKKWKPLALAAVMFVTGSWIGMACVPVEAKQAAAGATYQKDLDHCVDDYDTKDEMDACILYVRARWGKGPVIWPLADGGPTDAGGDR